MGEASRRCGVCCPAAVSEAGVKGQRRRLPQIKASIREQLVEWQAQVEPARGLGTVAGGSLR